MTPEHRSRGSKEKASEDETSRWLQIVRTRLRTLDLARRLGLWVFVLRRFGGGRWRSCDSVVWGSRFGGGDWGLGVVRNCLCVLVLEYDSVVLECFCHLKIGICSHCSVPVDVMPPRVSCGGCAGPRATCRLSIPGTADDARCTVSDTAKIPLSKGGTDEESAVQLAI